MAPISSDSDLKSIFLSVWVTRTVGVFSTLNFLKISGHFYAQMLKYLTLSYWPKISMELVKFSKY